MKLFNPGYHAYKHLLYIELVKRSWASFTDYGFEHTLGPHAWHKDRGTRWL